MSLSENLLRKLGDAGPGSASVSANHGGWTAEASVEKADTVGAQIRELTIRPTTAGRPLSGDEVKSRAEAIAKGVSGLREPLRLIEADPTRGEAILRSESPTIRGDKRSHYEMKIDSGRKASLRRYDAETTSTAKREQVPFSLTHEVLGELVDDVKTALD